jgi:hypothetical protein
MRITLAIAAALALAAPAPLAAMQTDNHGIHAVPAPGAVTIDGKLDDWDLSGQILMCYDLENLRDVYSARVAMMHDTNAWYVAIRWKDPIPLGNSHDPRFQADKGWAGDCVQLRVKTDRISHLTAWCFAKAEEPFIHVDYGKSLGEPFGGGVKTLSRVKGWTLEAGAEMAFLKDPDGRGYVQEMKIPWPLVTDKKVPAAGDRFCCGVELLWGEADWPVHRYADNLAEGATSREFFWTAKDAWGPVILEAKGGLSLPPAPWDRAVAEEKPEGPVAIAYDLPADARVTLALDDASGRRVRNLLAAAERKKGRQTELWDGLDDAGEPVEPGTYSVKGLAHDGLHVTYVTSFASPGRPGWGTADGKGAFYGDHTAPQAVACGPGDRLALACPMGEAGQHLIGVDLDGRRQWGLANRVAFGGGRISLATDGTILWIANGDDRKPGRFTIWRCDLKTGSYAPWKRKGPDGKDVLDLEIAPADGTRHCRAIAWRAGALAVLVAGDRRILLLDPETGDVAKELKEMPDGMAGCAWAKDGALLVSAGAALYTVDPATGACTKRIDGLDEPQGVAVDAAGQIYIAQRGRKQCVAVFDAAGNKIRDIGKPGGRPEPGRYDENAMRNPAQIAIDSRGRLWVTEETVQPKRTSVWGPDGRLALDLAGTTGYAAGGIVNPFDTARAFSERVEYRIDAAAQSFTPLSSLPDALGTGMEMICKIARAGGREYAQARSTARDAGMVKIYLRLPDGAWRHVAEWGNVGQGKSIDDPGHREWNAKFRGPLWDGSFGKAFLWVDTNDDGQAQRGEIELRDARLGRYYWGQAMGDDLTVAEPLSGQDAFLLFKPQGFTPGGAPRYRFDAAEIVRPVHGGEGMLAVGRDGRLYLNQSPLTGLDRTGKTLWTYPSGYVSVHGSHRAPAAAPGLLIGPSSIYGTAFVSPEIGELFYLNGNLGQNFLFTEDGLWVQSLYRDCRGWFDVPAQATPGMSCDAMTAGGESFGGGFCKAADGRYYTVGGGTAAVVMEVTGLDSLRRFGLRVTVTEKDVAAARELKIARLARKTATRAHVVRAAAKPLPSDGDLAAWAMEQGALEIKAGSHTVGRVKGAYDDASLYIAWQVSDGSPLQNAGQDERLMFITGDGVDLMLRTDPAAKGDAPQKGDLRLLLTVKGGKPFAVLYEAVVPGTKAEDRAAFSSPWRTVAFDRVRVVEIPLALKPARGGYAVTAAVPLRLLGLETLKGKTLRGDFGILASDSAGRECTARHYWANPATNNTNDVPDEAMLVPPLWGQIRFE